MRATLTYHSIDDSGSPISVSPRAFAAHARWLVSGAARALSLDAIATHPDEGGHAVAVTFDDGFLNSRAPIEQLLDSGVPVTVFVVSRHAGGTNAWRGRDQVGIPTLPLMSWDDLERLVAKGLTVGGHSRTHPHLTAVGPAALVDELAGGIEDVRARLGVTCEHFAYPYGDVDDAVARVTRQHYRAAHSTVFDCLSRSDDATRLPRLDMYYLRNAGGPGGWGSPAFRARLAWYRTRRRARAWLVPRPAVSGTARG